MKPEELDNMTPRQFHNRLNGWQQIRDFDWEDNWRRTRQAAYYAIPGGHWGKHVPDLYKDIRLPNDPKRHAQYRAEESPAEAAQRRYKAKAAMGRRGRAMNFDPDIEKLIRQHYQPDWGPHPDELVKKIPDS